jgi:hypothetical protein
MGVGVCVGVCGVCVVCVGRVGGGGQESTGKGGGGGEGREAMSAHRVTQGPGTAVRPTAPAVRPVPGRPAGGDEECR